MNDGEASPREDLLLQYSLHGRARVSRKVTEEIVVRIEGVAQDGNVSILFLMRVTKGMTQYLIMKYLNSELKSTTELVKTAIVSIRLKGVAPSLS